MYHFQNFHATPTVGSRVERGAQIGGKGLIAFRVRVRTNTTEVSTGWEFRDFTNLASMLYVPFLYISKI